MMVGRRKGLLTQNGEEAFHLLLVEAVAPCKIRSCESFLQHLVKMANKVPQSALPILNTLLKSLEGITVAQIPIGGLVRMCTKVGNHPK